MKEFLREVWTVARFDLGTGIRTKRALAAVLLYGLGAIALGVALVRIESRVADKIPLVQALSEVNVNVEGGDATTLVDMLSFFVDGDRDIARHLLQIPVFVSGFFWVTLAFLPFLIALVSHDVVNAEVRNRSARYVLLRCSRGALLAGKLLSHELLFLGVTVLSNLVLFAYAWVQLPTFDPGLSALYLARFWALTIGFGFCYLSLTALVSSLVDSGGLSVVTLLVVLIAFAILSVSDSVGFLSPSSWKTGLWSPRVLDVLASLAVFLAFGTVFLAGAWVRVARRDL